MTKRKSCKTFRLSSRELKGRPTSRAVRLRIILAFHRLVACKLALCARAFSRPTHFLREKPWGRGCYYYLQGTGNVLLLTPFSSSHSRRSWWRRLANFPVNSALMVAMLVKLLLVLIAWNTSPATSLEVSFSRSKYALCYKRFSFNFFHLSFVLFFSPRLSIFPNARWKPPFQVY